MLKKCKYLLLGLFVGLFGFISFSDGFNFIPDVRSLNSYQRQTILSGDCVIFGDFVGVGIYNEFSDLIFTYNDFGTFYCAESDQYFDVPNCPYGCTLYYYSGFLNSQSPEIDINYCVENGLCPIASGSWSELKINDVVHEGRPFINILIPDYIHWDYSVDENQYDVYVGSGYDQNYIDSVLKINSYRPDSSDFTNIFVSGLTLLFPYLIFALFLVFMWKLIKRIFKH